MGGTRLLAFLLIAYCGGWSNAAGQRVVFVDAAAEGAGDGSNWADAFANISTALALSQTGDQVWVAAGAYRAGPGRADTFRLKEGVEIFGGFAGNEDPVAFSLSQRDLTLNETILDGDIGVAGPVDNVFHIVTAENVTRTAVLDGFTIANGNASGLTLMQQDVGGGLFIVNASPTIRHSLIRDTQAGSRGGAVHIAGGSPYFSHCRFVGNRTTVTQAANNIGGAVYFAGTATSMATPLFVNCLFVGNRAGVGNGGSGGAMYGGEQATATLINCTLLHNQADTLTGGVFGSATIANSIFYRNQDHNGFDLTAQLRGAVAVSHSLVQGGWPGEGNVNADPLFRDPLGADGLAGTIDDDARLLAGSPCIDAGNNFAWPADAESADLDGAARFMNDPVAPDSGQPPDAALMDMGAYEKQSVCAASTDCDDALFCNGEESCSNRVCQPGSAPDCTDNVICTRDSCAEADRACVHQVDDSLCDNGLFCDGVEACDGLLGCLPGIAPDCDDAIVCTMDSCDEAGDVCVPSPDHGVCHDGLFCDGQETCDVFLGCQEALTGPCDANLYCDEIIDMCVDCLSDAHCLDAEFCNGVATCVSGICVPGTPPNCDDGIPCTVDSCDPASNACAHAPNHSSCNNGIFCDGQETCSPTLGCVPDTPPVCDDGLACTVDVCNPAADSCVSTPNHNICSDGLYCNGAERCGSTGCTTGMPPCETGSTCDENLDRCVVPPTDCVTDADCNDANSCTDDLCVLGVCERTFNESPCDDANACTTNDTCGSGTCTGEPIANCGAPPTDPGPGGTGPPTVDPPDEDTPPVIGDVPEADPGETDSAPVQPVPPAGSPSDPCPPGEPCDDEAEGPAASLDTDGDGVMDADDLCPSTPAGQGTDASGCHMEEPTPGRGTWVIEDARRCGACGALGAIGVFIMVCVPGTVLVLGRPRGRKFV